MDSPVALITGGGRGIGRAITLRLAELGYAVVVNCASNECAARQTAAEAQALGAAAIVVPADVSSTQQRRRLVEQTLASLGRIDLLVNNAGIAPRVRRDLLEVDEASYDQILAVNLKAALFLTQHVAGVFIAQRQRGMTGPMNIISISSIRAYTVNLTGAEYCISKAGLSMITRLFAARLAGWNIHVHEIRPALIDTDMATPVKDHYDKLIAAGVLPIARWGTPADVASAVATIARGHLPFSTGQILDVDGGFHLRSL